MHRVKLFPLESDGPGRIIHFGSMTAREPAEWRPSHGRLDLPQYLMRWLGVAPGESVNAWADPSGAHIHVGPVLGVLLDEDAATLLGSQGAAHDRSMYMTAREAGMLPVFFTAADVVPGADTVTGWVDRDGRWVRVQYPVPDVLYGRVIRDTVLHGLAAQHGVVPINSTGALSHSGVAEALRFFSETRRLVAARSSNPKPERSGGLRVTGDRGFWQITGRCDGRELSEGFSTPDGLFRFLRLLPGAGPTPEAGEGGRVCNLLAVAQKDRNGVWQVPLISLRRLAVGSVAARVTTASEPLDPDLVPAHFADRYPGLAGLREAAASVTVRAAAALEARFGRLGEIGLEIGCDPEGRPGVLKASADPSGLIARPLTSYPFEHALYLAGRAWEGRYSGAPLPAGV